MFMVHGTASHVAVTGFRFCIVVDVVVITIFKRSYTK